MARRKVPKGWYSKDVHWYLPKRKTPIAYSTIACSDVIEILSEETLTIEELKNRFDLRSEEARVLEQYVNHGYGAKKARTFFSREKR